MVSRKLEKLEKLEHGVFFEKMLGKLENNILFLWIRLENLKNIFFPIYFHFATRLPIHPTSLNNLKKTLGKAMWLKGISNLGILAPCLPPYPKQKYYLSVAGNLQRKQVPIFTPPFHSIFELKYRIYLKDRRGTHLIFEIFCALCNIILCM